MDKKCARGDEICVCNGVVSYGYGKDWIMREVNDHIWCNN